MRILVVGAGDIGFNLARELSASGHDVSAVDSRPDRVRRIRDKMDVLAVCGSGASARVLVEAGITECEMVIAVTDRDELNIIVCMIAREYGVKTKIARVRSPEFTDGSVLELGRLGIDRVINPEEITVAAMRKLIETPGAVEVADFADCDVRLLGFDVPEDAGIVDRPLADVRQALAGEGFLIVAIERKTNGHSEVIIPHGDDRLRAGDGIYVLLDRQMLPLMLPMIYHKIDKVRRVVLFGASREGQQLAAAIEPLYRDVILIEPDERLAEQAAERLKRTLVIRGHPTEPEVLEEARVANAGFFVATSEDDQANLMSALLARKAGAAKVMVMVQEPAHVPIVSNLDIDVVINPWLVTVGEILRYVRSGPVLSLVRIGEGAAEATELVAVPGSEIVDRPLREIRFPRDALIGAILRGGQMVIPDGNSVIRPGEKVVVFALSQAIEAVQAMFGGRPVPA